MKRIGVVGNCQAASIGNALFHLFGDAEVSGFVVGDVYKKNWMAKAESILSSCDVVFSHYLPDHFGMFGTEALCGNVRKLILVPPVIFGGFHPDCTELTWGANFYSGPMRHYHSAIVAAAYSLDIPVDRVPQLFNRLVFQRLGYYAEFAKARALLQNALKAEGFDIAEEWPRWVRSGVFMHTYNHPKSQVLASIAKLVAVKAGLLPERTPTPDMSIDSLAGAPVWPVYPELAEALGLRGSYIFKENGLPDIMIGEHNLLSLKDFIRKSYESYADVAVEAFNAPTIVKTRDVLAALPSS